jgi:hypothetical protein
MGVGKAKAAAYTDSHSVPGNGSGSRRKTGHSGNPPFARSLFGQVVLALIVGVIAGFTMPEFGVKLEPLGDVFIKRIKMIIPAIPAVELVLVLSVDWFMGIARAGQPDRQLRRHRRHRRLGRRHRPRAHARGARRPAGAADRGRCRCRDRAGVCTAPRPSGAVAKVRAWCVVTLRRNWIPKGEG